jgi:alpha-beta hydrolase superfamily lysophospholipase
MITASPLYFGQTKSLFGWYHRTDGQAVHACAVVLCPPLGHEYMYSHRAYRVLAERLASAGFPVLRFDYYATGDSIGDVHDSHLLRRWYDSIGMAIDEIRRRSGQQTVTLVGLRMGATLAATAAAERTDIDGLVLWNPCTTGRSYIRQVKALAMTSADMGGKPVINQTTGDLEALGFAIPSALVSDLSKLDLTHVTHRPAKRALILSRDDMGSDEALVSHLEAGGTTVTAQAFPHYASFMLPPIHSQLPMAALDQIVAWFSQTYVGTTAAPGPRLVTFDDTTRTVDLGNVRERAVTFDGNQMFGIIAEPEHPAQDTPAFVLLNTGGDHHVGPHGLYAPFARQLASQGIRVLRFDISGLGDTPPRTGAQDNSIYANTALGDVRMAIDYVRTECGSRRVILGGMCSGAYYSIHAAHEGLNLDGVIAINPQLYWRQGDPLDVNPFWNAQETRRIGNALLSKKYWGRLIRGDVDFKHVAHVLTGRVKVIYRDLQSILRRKPSMQPSSSSPQDDTMSQRLDQRTRKNDISELIRQDTDTYLIFSFKDTGLLYFEHSAGKSLPTLLERSTFTLSVAEDEGHTFMPLSMQAQLRNFVTQWLVTRHGPKPSKRWQFDTSGQLESSSGAA